MMKFKALIHFAGAPCSPNAPLLGFPTWYQYLPSVDGSNPCAPQISKLTDIWLIAAAIIEILLRVAAIAAVVFVIWGGVTYITSQGEPDKTAQARKTIINALAGLTIAVAAAALVTFIAGRFQ